jgi:hypothetical protein
LVDSVESMMMHRLATPKLITNVLKQNAQKIQAYMYLQRLKELHLI